MRRVFLVLCMLPVFVFGQYADTINGRLTVKYNDPTRMKMSILAGGTMEIQGVSGSVALPGASVDVHLRPVNWFVLHGALSQQFQFGWQFQKIQDTRNLELGGRLYLKKYVLAKTKTFTAGNKAWNYDFLFPVKVFWNLGLSGSYRYGNGIFNSGDDPNTSIRFKNLNNNQILFLKKAAVPYTFSEVSVGFAVNTASNLKVVAHLPFGQEKARRMKTYTEFRAELVFGTHMRIDSTITRKPGETANYINYNVLVQRKENLGFKFQGVFRRKWYGFKVEAGVRPGIHYRFSQNEKDAILDRSYLIFGLGIGWM